MNCYNHQNDSAIGICKNCCKGLCAKCASDVGNGLACKNKCEVEVEQVNIMINRGKRVYKSISATFTVYVAMGTSFIAWGIVEGKPLSIIFAALGSVFVFVGIYNLRNNMIKKN